MWHGIIQKLKRSYYNCRDGIAPELRYGLIKYNVKGDTFVIVDKRKQLYMTQELISWTLTPLV